VEAPKVKVMDELAAVVELPWRARFAATLPPGVGETDYVVFIHVDKDYKPPAPSLWEALRLEASRVGYPGALAFLTAADISGIIEREVEAGGSKAWVYATIGLTPPVCPGGSGILHEPLRASTINVAVVAWEPLTMAGALDLLRTVAEAKAAASSELLLRCPGAAAVSWRPVGTVSDAIAVLWPASASGGAETAGHATTLGGSVGLEVYKSIVERGLGILGAEGIAANALGLGVEALAGLVGEAYARAPVPGVDRGRVVEAARKLLRHWLRDPNVQALIIASRELDVHGSAGGIPGLTAPEFQADTPRMVADELLGMALASYLAGSRGVFSMYWVERLKKEGVIPEAPMFEDDVASALIAAALTKVLDRLLGTEPGVEV
jgi:alpha-ribazole phosphatase CobZ